MKIQWLIDRFASRIFSISIRIRLRFNHMEATSPKTQLNSTQYQTRPQNLPLYPSTPINLAAKVAAPNTIMSWKASIPILDYT